MSGSLFRGKVNAFAYAVSGGRCQSPYPAIYQQQRRIHTMCCCHEHKNDDCGCGCMRIYHLMDDGGECTDKAILCRLDDMKKDECCKKQDECGCEKSMMIAVTVTESPMADAAVTSRSVPKSRIAPSPIIPRSGAASKPDGSPRPDGVIHTQNNIRGVALKKRRPKQKTP